MKRIFILVLSLLFLTGCSQENHEMNRAIGLRERLLTSGGFTADVQINVDYKDKLYSFLMACQGDNLGSIAFTVQKPDSISGIAGKLSADGGALTFDDQILAFPLLPDSRISPVSAPWLLVHSLRSGYISACGKDNDGLRIQIDDTYMGKKLQVDVWTSAQDLPIHAEIFYDGRRAVSIAVNNFCFV